MPALDLDDIRDHVEPYLMAAGLAEIRRRMERTEFRWESLTTAFQSTFAELEDRDAQILEKAFIYAAGSMARGEATDHSDLDLFVVDCLTSRTAGDADGDKLNFVETAHLVSALDFARGDAGFSALSRGGAFVKPLSMDAMIRLIGDPQLDDPTNSFTARILLLSESRPLHNALAYEAARERALDRYWHSKNREDLFLPILLVNDVRRWWGALGLNFEHYHPRTGDGGGVAAPTPEREFANLKLRYARLLACYTVLIALVAQSDPDHGLTRADAKVILDLTPVERLIATDQIVGDADVAAMVGRVLRAYDSYLTFMSDDENSLKELENEEKRTDRKHAAYDFHKEFVKLFEHVGRGKTLYEYSIV